MKNTTGRRSLRNGWFASYSRMAGIALSAILLLSACATHIAASSSDNPPPAEPLENFDHFTLLPLDGTAEAKKQTAAFSRIDHNLQVTVDDLTRTWEKPAAGGRKLEIAPYVQDLKFIGGGARFFVGAMAGSSAVVIKLRLTDADTKAVIGEPQFYQRADAWGGAWSVGRSDNGMLGRIAQVAADYLRNNHDRAVGGPTGYIRE